MSDKSEFARKVLEFHDLCEARGDVAKNAGPDGKARGNGIVAPLGRAGPDRFSAARIKALSRSIKQAERRLLQELGPKGKWRDQPFAQLARRGGLSKVERKALLYLLGRYLAENVYCAREGGGDDDDDEREDRVVDVLFTLFPRAEAVVEWSTLFCAQSRLVKGGLVVREYPHCGCLQAVVSIDDKVAERVLSMGPAEADDQADAEDDADVGPEFDDETPVEVIKPGVSMADVILPGELSEFVEEAIYFHASEEAAKLASKVPGLRNSGAILALFYGPPGTGKTMTASAIAAELNKPLALVRYSDLMDKYYGESEKRLKACFEEARKHDCVLLFDEADALLTRRSGKQESYGDSTLHRMKNMFLQELESIDGVVILTTNLAESLDPALERRLTLKVEVPVPDAKTREVIWAKMLAPLDFDQTDVNPAALARAHNVSGGVIKNAVTSAARRAAFLGHKGRPVAFGELLKQAIAKESKSCLARQNARAIGFRV